MSFGPLDWKGERLFKKVVYKLVVPLNTLYDIIFFEENLSHVQGLNRLKEFTESLMLFIFNPMKLL